MTYQVLARRLRPQRFDEVVGQEHVTRTLKAAIGANRVAHAFLLTGPRGVGKTTTARILAKALNCEKGPAPEPCNACSTCREIADGHAFDVLEVDGASHTQVDKMRDLMETVAHQPIKSRYKIYIIDEVHMLSQHSFNALLKTLEEPPPHVKFIFATTDAHKVLPTVVSRCQRYDLKRIGFSELLGHLQRVATAEQVTLDPEALALVAREAEGSLRDAQSLLDQVVAAAGAGADIADVRAVLGAADRRLVVSVAEAILAGDGRQCLVGLGQLYEHGYDAQRFCRDLLQHFRDLAVLRATGDRSLLGHLGDAEVETVVSQAERRTVDDLERFFHLLLEADEALSTPTRTIEPQLVLEMAVLRLATLPPLLPVDEILRRLEALGSDGGTPPTRPTTEGRGAGTKTPRAGASAAPSGGGDQDLWDRFLGLVRGEKLSLYMTLRNGRVVPGAPEVLRIGLTSDVMRREVQRPDILARLHVLAEQAAGRALRVEVGPMPDDLAAETPHARASRRTEETLSDPLVQAAVEIFGAEVRGVRDRRDGGDR